MLTEQPLHISHSADTQGVIAAATCSTINIIDFRCNATAQQVTKAHETAVVRSVDMTHSAEHQLLSAGDDGALRWWDLRCVVDKACM